MKSFVARYAGCAVALSLLAPPAVDAALVVDDIPLDLSGPSILTGSVPTVTNGSTVNHTVTLDDVANGSVYFQFESNENDNAIDLRLTFSQDSSFFYDWDVLPGNSTTDALATLSGPLNQTAYEWEISGITGADIGSLISVLVEFANTSNGPERARFSQSSIALAAVPEASAFLVGSLLFGAFGAVRSRALFGRPRS